jgi:hypothetical protein
MQSKKYSLLESFIVVERGGRENPVALAPG